MEFSPASMLTRGKIATVKSAAIAACDGLDGLRNRVISNPDACRFDPASLLFPGASSDSCLTSAEVTIVRKIQSDLKLFDGRKIYSRVGFGELNASHSYSLLARTGSGLCSVKTQNTALTPSKRKDLLPKVAG